MEEKKDSIVSKVSRQIQRWGTAKIAIVDKTLEEIVEEDFLKIVKLLATTIDDKEPPYHGHSERVARIALSIAEELNCPADKIKNIQLSAYLHDIGKIGIDEDILRKTTLSAEEMREVRKNHIEGAGLLKDIFYLKECVGNILHLRERFDGKGYPSGLKGEEIPLTSRILAVAEAFDAMRSCRLFREGLSINACLAEIQECAGNQFDPKVVAAFHSAVDKGRIKKEVEETRIKNLEAHYLTDIAANALNTQKPAAQM